MEQFDLICLGAGPTGLACAIEAVRAGLKPLVIDKGAICNSIYHYPVNMVFFTTPELLEIGDLPLVSPAEKPTRVEALKYYRKAAEHYGLKLKLYEKVARLDGKDGHFIVSTRTARGEERSYRAAKVVVATGYYDLPNELGIPGERPAARFALLQRTARILESGRGCGWREEFRCRSGAGPLAQRRSREHGAPQSGARSYDQILGTPGHTESHCGRADPHALEFNRPGDYGGQCGDSKRSRAAFASGKAGVPADRVSPGL
jgi:hypothetical protein